jgi:capsular polysaccharide transport system permease protein
MTNDQVDPDDVAASPSEEVAASPSEENSGQVKPGAGGPAKKAWQGGWKTPKPPGKSASKQGAQAEAAGNVVAPIVTPGALRLPGGTARQLELLLANREHQLRRFLLRFGLFVLLPCFVVWFYTALIATPRYQCVYQITYQTYQPSTSLTAGLTQTDFGSSQMDSIDYGTILYEYVTSASLAQQVDKLLDLRAHYSARNIDWFSRLSPNATQKQFLAYWQSRVKISEGFGGYLTLTVEGFDPQFTLKLAQTINALANNMIDQIGAQARNTEIDSAKQQLTLAASGLQAADAKLTAFRNANGDLDPSFMATQIGTIEAALDGQLATLKAQLTQDEANILPNSAIIVQLKLQISALEQQIQAERTRLANNNGQQDYSDTVSKYEDALASQLLASSTFQAAQQGLVLAQADAAQQQNYVVPFVPPILPDHPTAPDPLDDTFITFLACVGLYGIGNLLFSAFRDQAGI